MGRFNSPDPSRGVHRTDPGSWNKYAYVQGDPVNFYDHRGLTAENPSLPAGIRELCGSTRWRR